ncbi:MraY family glycosyltransferase [Oceanobacillus profundus]|uniref:Undecaprenyl/decaprenyl-phosphate alpha-N-acetylglucosaminyl 1-phosphate transferase n=1 Tax=Oceanobacillus profundus TaxID=372463 RepID=A0A417YNU9_9BACI|nr:MraY family glycosyltransferase [Oceanobacillus profundus]MBR3121767.1 undecaprenyl/decaprenyl-phosphate alpha-N-acetylglucosaminyl 1-phosphate transferase [Oceanobacillus sp.]PAE30516.1 undecaprenyl-phosphate alpha-N-acetylglucosaminyl 1-phosphate transferase [Paenibacillus sp. 7884-2]MCM3398891.1 undecaprenyl/decaprenyl-phosphate alpha-N-acetylglucosaminyl 1-phosphate transferase [Oceanobacillus profundus]MDO6451826.1 MraY family glycosyltransferase [Oceanobacillus profundus]RHW35494.1 un
MFNYIDLLIAFLIAFTAALLLTYPVKMFAIKIGAMDKPNSRKIHINETPRLGGLAIFIGALLGTLYLQPYHQHLPEILIGSIIILITGALDDRFTIKPILKLTGQLAAAFLLVSSGLIIERITIPIFGVVEFGFLSVLITILWVVGIANAINLIDGLDGLATGVTTIAMTSIFVMALIDTQIIVAFLSIALIGANLGFLYHNFYPAKIYMGDTGSNFLGYMIAVLSMLGLFKNVTFFSFIIPVIILAVPIFDTLVAIVRRAYNKESIMAADNKHLHYQLIQAGYSHRKAVIIIYIFSALFGVMGILFSNASPTLSLIISLFVILLLYIFAELAGIVMGGKRPIVSILRKILRKIERSQ